MIFLEQLHAHRGGLLLLKTQLYWTSSGYDKNPGRVCLMLDAFALNDATRSGASAVSDSAGRKNSQFLNIVVHLLIDGSLQWVWTVEQDVELL